jgi:NitT/TauT family transport system permease protein
MRAGLSRERATQIAGVAAVLVAILLFLQYGLSHVGIKEYVVPQPTAVWKALHENWSDVLGPALWKTARVVVPGLAIGVLAGIALAVAIDMLPALEYVLLPYVIALVMTPMIAIVPVVFLQWDDTVLTRMLIVAAASAPMTLLNSITGLRRTPAIRMELMRSMRASRLQALWKVKLPSALPAILTGVLISAIFAVIAAVGTEYVAGQNGSGLGATIVYYSSLAQTPTVFAAIALLIVLGIALYALLAVLQRRLTQWAE